MLKKSSLLCALIALLSVASCNCDSADPVNMKGLYVVGTKNTGATHDRVYSWHNDKETFLTDGTRYCGISGLDVSGTLVYTCGYENVVTTSKAVYWKDKEQVSVTDGSFDAAATDIFVADDQVYVAYYERNSNGIIVPKVWQNGTITPLSDGSKMGMATSIFVSERGDVYVSGYEEVDIDIYRAKYWKNGNEVFLADGTYTTMATSIVVEGNDVYVAGHKTVAVPTETGFLNQSHAQYWKNGNAVVLSEAESDAFEIKVKQGTVYVAGFDGHSTYWIDAVNSGPPTNSIYVSDIAIDNTGIVYFSTADGRLWKDNVLDSYFDGTHEASVIRIKYFD